ncbi:hypothetical protein HPB47_004602, partial [Ixodes persulcatus]
TADPSAVWPADVHNTTASLTSARPELSHEPRAAEVSWLPGLGSVAVTRAERQRAAPKASDPEDALAPCFVYAAAWRCAKWPFYISSSLGHASCRTTGGGQMAAVVRLPCRPGGSCAEMSAPRSNHLIHLQQCHKSHSWQQPQESDLGLAFEKIGVSEPKVYSSYVSGSPPGKLPKCFTSSFLLEKGNELHHCTSSLPTEVAMANSSHFLHGQALPQSPTEVGPPLRNGMGLSTEEHVGISFCQDDWAEDQVLWRSLPTTMGVGGVTDPSHFLEDEFGGGASLGVGMSASYYGGRRSHSHRLSSKVEMVYSLLSMLGTHDKDDLSRTLLTMSGSQESCIAMRQSGCLPLLIQLLHGAAEKEASSPTEENAEEQRRVMRELRLRASQALHNVVHAHPDDKHSRREARVLRLLEQIRDFCDYLRDIEACIAESNQNETGDQHPGPAIAALMKLSFDEEHRHAMCQL